MIRAKTKVTGLFGYPVEHSLSPNMHNAGFAELDLDYCYVTFLVEPELLGEATKGIQAMNLSGVNVTIPHKENVIRFLDEVNEEARFIGAVNTIKNQDGRLIGYNTDGKGFVKSLEEASITFDGKDVFVIGAGGASRAVSYYLSEKARNLMIFDLDKNKLETLVSDLQKIRTNVHLEPDLEKTKTSQLIINATPLGLKPDDPLPMDLDKCEASPIVCDLIYKDTPLLKEAKKRGLTTLNGLGMLLWQGIIAFEIWTEAQAPVDIMRKALIRGFENQ